METNTKNEIDLIETFLKIYIYLRKYFWIFIIAVSAGILFTIVKNVLSGSNYHSSMIIETKTKSNYMYAITFEEFQDRFEKNPGELILKVLNSANSLIENNNFTILAERMGLTEDQTEQIISINAQYKYIKEEPVSNFITIYANTKNPNLFNPLNNAIVNYINNNKYIKELYITDSIFLSKVISEIDIKIKELDSLQNQIMNDNLEKSNITIMGNASFMTESIQLVSMRGKLQSELNNLEKVNIVEDFYIPKKSSFFKIKEMIINIFIFILISFFVLLLIIINKKALKYKN